MSPIGAKRPKSVAIRNIAYIERHNICPGGRLFRIWDENSPCYCTGIIDIEDYSKSFACPLSAAASDRAIICCLDDGCTARMYSAIVIEH